MIRMYHECEKEDWYFFILRVPKNFPKNVAAIQGKVAAAFVHALFFCDTASAFRPCESYHVPRSCNQVAVSRKLFLYFQQSLDLFGTWIVLHIGSPLAQCTSSDFPFWIKYLPFSIKKEKSASQSLYRMSYPIPRLRNYIEMTPPRKKNALVVQWWCKKSISFHISQQVIGQKTRKGCCYPRKSCCHICSHFVWNSWHSFCI